MDFENIKTKFHEFKKKHEAESFSKIDNFFEEIKKIYLDEKTEELMNKGLNRDSAHNKARQSWRTFVGHSLQGLLAVMLKELFEGTDVKFVKDSELRGSSLSKEKDLVRRMLEIHFNDYSFLPDADIIAYRYDKKLEKVKIYCIFSVKNSFRERGFETTYWKLKLMENETTRNIKVFMITPDKDNEISMIRGVRGPKKTRVILEYELDSIYI
ncbi:MAG: restriction endonuclease [Nanoarchaeota archaeon]|nr:restriction endonuclease [Nanoarchaeota archaeon]